MSSMFFHCHSISPILSTDCKYNVIVTYFHPTYMSYRWYASVTLTVSFSVQQCLVIFFSCFYPSFLFISFIQLTCNEQGSVYRIMSFSVCIWFYSISDIDKFYISNLSSYLAFPTDSTWKKLHTVQLACFWFNFGAQSLYSLFPLVAAIIGHLSSILHQLSPEKKNSFKRAAQIYQQSTCDSSVKQAVENLFEGYHVIPVNHGILNLFKRKHPVDESLVEGAIQIALNHRLCMI